MSPFICPAVVMFITINTNFYFPSEMFNISTTFQLILMFLLPGKDKETKHYISRKTVAKRDVYEVEKRVELLSFRC